MPWGKFFDLTSFEKHTDVMELSDFLEDVGTGPIIDHVLHLQSPKWGEGEEFVWDPSVREDKCDFGTYPGTKFEHGDDGLWHWRYWGRGSEISSKALTCYRTMGNAHIVYDTLVNTPGDVIMVARFETLTHVQWAGSGYWRVRRK